MITRILIRIKVVQMLYSYFLTKKERSVAEATKELAKSLDKAYELYMSLLVLMIDLTSYQDLRLDQAKHKYLPTEEDLNPNTKFVENLFIDKLKNNKSLLEYQKDAHISWQDDDIFIKLMLDKIVNSDIYKDYMAEESRSYEEDCELWRNILKKIILKDEELVDILESKSVYWNDDLSIMGTFALKTIKQFQMDENGGDIQKMYKDDEDSQFGEKLFLTAIRESEENNDLIDKYIQTDSWDKERIPFMDRVIIGVALSEIKNYDQIPLKVSINEYIEIAKYYSTVKSSSFVNGMLNSIILYLKKQGRIIKE